MHNRRLQSLGHRLEDLRSRAQECPDKEDLLDSLAYIERGLTVLALDFDCQRERLEEAETWMDGSEVDSDESYPTSIDRSEREFEFKLALRVLWYRAGRLRLFRSRDQADRVDALILQLSESAERSSSRAEEPSSPGPEEPAHPASSVCHPKRRSSWPYLLSPLLIGGVALLSARALIRQRGHSSPSWTVDQRKGAVVTVDSS